MPLTNKQYNEITQFFSSLKVLHGPEFVNATLNRHRDLQKALIDYEKNVITELESNLSSKE